MAIPSDIYSLCLERARHCVTTQEAPGEHDVPCGASLEFLNSVWRREYQRHISETQGSHHRNFQKYFSLYRLGASILSIARRREVNFSPYLLARIFLEHVLELRKEAVSACVRDPKTIGDLRLRKELSECIDADEHCGPKVDELKASSGKMHEALLELGLRVRPAGNVYSSPDRI